MLTTAFLFKTLGLMLLFGFRMPLRRFGHHIFVFTGIFEGTFLNYLCIFKVTRRDSVQILYWEDFWLAVRYSQGVFVTTFNFLQFQPWLISFQAIGCVVVSFTGTIMYMKYSLCTLRKVSCL